MYNDSRINHRRRVSLPFLRPDHAPIAESSPWGACHPPALLQIHHARRGQPASPSPSRPRHARRAPRRGFPMRGYRPHRRPRRAIPTPAADSPPRIPIHTPSLPCPTRPQPRIPHMRRVRPPSPPSLERLALEDDGHTFSPSKELQPLPSPTARCNSAAHRAAPPEIRHPRRAPRLIRPRCTVPYGGGVSPRRNSSSIRHRGSTSGHPERCLGMGSSSSKQR
ncbi:hypothetical protein PVAP13_9KG414480 [Panicum virgatum]|uniref:Uncharacterized protein n=1 Tax=Panicum virgatum TaxID=38727 RepID=A0A8T0N8M3_PANVG|nr:hypothetical protein PVAP13_9KG414480 [Panicum virgatum]